MTVEQQAPPATLEPIGHVALITFNRPEARNAINAAMSIAVGEAIAELERDPDLRVGVITGAGKAFCAGADLKAVAAQEPLIGPDQKDSGFGGFERGYVGKPLIAAVNGFALGGGTELVLACDLAVIAESATLGLPEVKRGLIAAGGGLIRLPRQIPRKLAAEVVLTGAPIDSSTALAWGLVNDVAPDDEVVAAALRLAHEVAENAPLAVQASKRVMHDSLALGDDWEPAAWRISDQAARALLKTEDTREGLRAFAEKRKPDWQGR